MSSITFRAGWGARHGQGDYLAGLRQGFTVHHSWRPRSTERMTPEEEVALMLGMERHHVVENGWDGIGYHWVIFQSGRIYEGRGWDRIGAHAGKTANRTMYGVAFVIDGNVELPSAAAITSFRLLQMEALRTGRVPGDYRIDGHRDHMARDCPGDRLYAILPALRHDRIEIPTPSGEIATSPPATPAPPNLDRIIVPTPAHIDEAVRVSSRWDAESVRDGIALVEVLLRGMQRANVRHAAPALIANALSEWLRR